MTATGEVKAQRSKQQLWTVLGQLLTQYPEGLHQEHSLPPTQKTGNNLKPQWRLWTWKHKA